jgi:hypothetical protein
MLLGELDQRIGLSDRFAGCFVDHRRPDLVEHPVEDLVRQRILRLSLGYEDLNDHDSLRADALLATAVGKVDPTGSQRRREQDRGSALAGKPGAGLALLRRTGGAAELGFPDLGAYSLERLGRRRRWERPRTQVLGPGRVLEGRRAALPAGGGGRRSPRLPHPEPLARLVAGRPAPVDAATVHPDLAP